MGVHGRGYQAIPRLRFKVEALPSDAASFNAGSHGGSADAALYESLLRYVAQAYLPIKEVISMYLSTIKIDNYKGIKHLKVSFDPKINIIIGENGSCKSALIDAIRLLYNLGEQRRDLFVTEEDFHVDLNTFESSDTFSITYQFRGLTDKQKGAFFEYMVIENDPQHDYAQITLVYEKQTNKGPKFSYYTGKNEGQKADYRTFELFQHYYLDALRDSTKDLLSNRRNILGDLLHRDIAKSNRVEEFEGILARANDDLLQRGEVKTARDNINDNLHEIFKNYHNNIGLHIENPRIQYVLNLVKPYLPYDQKNLIGAGMSLPQNSLGSNNLIYIATVLGDIKQRVEVDELTHYALLIEEPEAHLHPQLQLSLYNFLTAADESDNSQLFITTHSPTLTSKVPLDNLILLDQQSYQIGSCFRNRASDQIVQDSTTRIALSEQDFLKKKYQLQRYLDVTRSQLFFSRGILLVEGISEQLLIPSFCRLLDFNLEDYRIELVDVNGISFYPFLALFNSSQLDKRLPKLVSVISDDDRFTESKDKSYAFDRLTENSFALLGTLHQRIFCDQPATRVKNIQQFVNGQTDISVNLAYKTFEYAIAYHNVHESRKEFENNTFVRFIRNLRNDKFEVIKRYVQSLPEEKLSDDDKHKIAILLWKLIPSKAEFAQEFAMHLIEEKERTKRSDRQVEFNIPSYITEALDHLKKS